MPVPHTAMVPAAPDSAPWWAAVSMPDAMPDTTVMPFWLSACPNSRAIRIACGVAWRLPTMATAGRCSSSGLPRRNSSGGGAMPSANAAGKSASQESIRWQPFCCSQSSAASAAARALLLSCQCSAACLPYRPIWAIASAGADRAADALPYCVSRRAKLSAPMYGVRASCIHEWRSASVISVLSLPQRVFQAA